MLKRKTLLSLALSITMLMSISSPVFATNNTVPEPQADILEGSIGQTYVSADGTKISFFNGEVLNSKTRMTSTVYNGYIFDHDSRWDGNLNGNQAQAETESYEKGNYSVPHRNYTRVRVVDTFIPAIIYEDSDRKWGDRYSQAQSSRLNGYFEISFSMRSYWGDSTT